MEALHRRHVSSHVPARVGPAPLVHNDSPTSINTVFAATWANGCMPSSAGVLHQAPYVKTVVAKAVEQTSLLGPFDNLMPHPPGRRTNLELNAAGTWNDYSKQQPRQQPEKLAAHNFKRSKEVVWAVQPVYSNRLTSAGTNHAEHHA